MTEFQTAPAFANRFVERCNLCGSIYNTSGGNHQKQLRTKKHRDVQYVCHEQFEVQLTSNALDDIQKGCLIIDNKKAMIDQYGEIVLTG